MKFFKLILFALSFIINKLTLGFLIVSIIIAIIIIIIFINRIYSLIYISYAWVDAYAYASTQARRTPTKGTGSGPVINARQWTPIKTSKLIDSNTRLETSKNTKIAAKRKIYRVQHTPTPHPPTPEAI